MQFQAPHKTLRAACTAVAGAVAGQAFDEPAIGTLISAEIVLGTAESVSGLTVENVHGTDILNGAGAGPFTANKILTLNDIGGVNVAGKFMAKATTVDGATGTFEVHLHVNGRTK